MENNEFLIDHRAAGNEASATAESINSRGNLMDDEDFGGDHSQLAFKPSSGGGGANNNLLLEATGTAADGTFVLDGDDYEEQEARRSAGSDDDETDDKHELLLSSLPPQPQQHYGTDDDISKSSSPLNEYSQAAAAVVEEVKPPTSSSIDDFEFIATPQRAEINATAETTAMDNSNLLDFESSPPAPANLVETLLTTGEDLKAHKDSAAAYLENEFTQFKSGSQQAAQDFMNLTSTQTKPVKDVYNDFMEAERGHHHHDVIQPVKKDREPSPVRPAEEVMDEKPIETISSTPIVPIEATTTITHPAVEDEKKKSDVEPIKSSAQFEATNSDDEDDLHEQFSDTPPALPERHFQPEPEQKKPIVEKEEVVEEKKKVNVMDEEPQQQAPAPALPVFVKEEAKTKPVEVIKPTVTPVVAAPATSKPVKDELITTSAEEMFCKFGLGELRYSNLYSFVTIIGSEKNKVTSAVII